MTTPRFLTFDAAPVTRTRGQGSGGGIGGTGAIPCFGVGCELHSKCVSYALVDGSHPAQMRIYLCGEPGLRPRFQQIPQPLAGGDRRGGQVLLQNGRRLT